MINSLPVRHDVSMRAFNTFGVEASTHSYLEVTSSAMLLDAVRNGLLGQRRLVLGGGSNLLWLDNFEGIVLHMRTRGIAIEEGSGGAHFVHVAAGENWHDFVQWTIKHGMPGLENLSLIPGSVGAAPIQNIGAYGVEAGELIHAVRVMHLDTGDIAILTAGQCAFAYRDSIFKRELSGKVAILEVIFALPKRWSPRLAYAELAQEVRSRGWDAPSPAQVAEAVIAIRRRKLPDPAVLGNAGSFFKNPVVGRDKRDELLGRYPSLASYPQADGSWKLAAGWLIDQCGWKGKRIGDAGVYEKQALVLVNHGRATGAAIRDLSEQIRGDVFNRFGVQLEPEPIFISAA